MLTLNMKLQKKEQLKIFREIEGNTMAAFVGHSGAGKVIINLFSILRSSGRI